MFNWYFAKCNIILLLLGCSCQRHYCTICIISFQVQRLHAELIKVRHGSKDSGKFHVFSVVSTRYSCSHPTFIHRIRNSWVEANLRRVRQKRLWRKRQWRRRPCQWSPSGRSPWCPNQFEVDPRRRRWSLRTSPSGAAVELRAAAADCCQY